ncbi:MAG: hypothetical protein LBJ84_00920 [Oscillospiraceae bacterium]|jgi:hypothetical protein|nr:hypothetical protein [Oscillospiraceae bacterium]
MTTQATNQTATPLAAALAALGARGKCRVVPVGMNRYTVFIDGRFYGIWDNIREAFVDRIN